MYGGATPHPKPLGAAHYCAGEFEPHVGCWMGWPYSPYLWRDGAKPAQQQYAAIAKAISEFEPVWMFADPSVSACLRPLSDC